MCGINGLSFNDRQLVEKMNDVIKHRGPDDAGVYSGEKITLGNVRLSVIDISPKGHMPMHDKQKCIAITYNGEIYNFRELRKKLIKKGYTFFSQTDTEVIINLYKEYGKACFKQLNGMFALAIWDNRSHELTLARDRSGIKPLYYVIQNNKLYFSSELKALYAVLPQKPQIDEIAFSQYLRFLYVPAPRTMLQDVIKVEPGQMIIWTKQHISKSYYWQPCLKQNSFKNYQEAVIALRRALVQSVERQLISDRKIGLFLSGGIDSTTLLGIATQKARQTFHTFSVEFTNVAEAGKFNADAQLAKQAAEYNQAQHHTLSLSPEQALNSFIALSKGIDEPIANPTHIPTYYMAQQARKHIVVALGGDGGDELFGGYDRYLIGFSVDMYHRIPLNLRKTFINKWISKVKKNQSFQFLELLNASSLKETYMGLMGQKEDEIRSIAPNAISMDELNFSNLRGFDSTQAFYQQFMWLDFMHWLPEESLMRSDKMTMLNSLEQRVPLLDNELIDLALQIPFHWKVGLRQRKKILRDAAKPFIPVAILNQPKRGFFSPGAKWLRHPLWIDYVEDLFSSSSFKNSSFFDVATVNQMFQQHISGEAYHMHMLWAVLFFQAWHQGLGGDQ
jgi:asparagine synthase (glutamine-hydrolysing)